MSDRALAPTPARLALALVAVLAVLAGCGDQQPVDVADQQAAAEGGAADGGGEAARLDLQEPPDYGDPVDLPEGIAATVDGAEIDVETVEGRFDAVANVPEVSHRLEGENGAAVAEAYRAQILQNLIIQEIVAQRAKEMGVEPSEEDIAAVERQAVADFDGDKREFEEALRADGVSAQQLADELVFAARVDAIRAEVAGEVEAEEPPEDAALAPADMALYGWLEEQLAAADVTVDREYGIWAPDTGEVVPPSAAEGSG